MVQRQELDLAIGDIFRIGDTTITVIDIENGEITFKIDDADLNEVDQACDQEEDLTISLPR